MHDDLAYLAPESLANDEAGPTADIWSFGCLFKYLFSRKHPWTNASYATFGGASCFIADLPSSLESLRCTTGTKEILKVLLGRDPSKQPSAADLLSHPYFAKIDDRKD